MSEKSTYLEIRKLQLSKQWLSVTNDWSFNHIQHLDYYISWNSFTFYALQKCFKVILQL